jgi:uncharacterized repeat protein (TIGR01451 family)
MKLFTLALAIPSLSLVSVAAAAPPHVDLGVSVTAPAVHVYENGTYQFHVANTGNRNATNVQLVIDLPRTGTSPQVYLMGTLGARDPRCTYANQRLTCALGTINRNAATTVNVDLTLPYSIAPLALAATVSSTGSAAESFPANNSLTHVAQLALYPTTFAGGAVETRVCAGTGLTSFFECELFPSSISLFTSTLHPNGSITIDGEPGYTGAWWPVGNDTLHIEYSDGTTIYAMDAKSVGGDCFEGRLSFDGNSVAMHEVCAQ